MFAVNKAGAANWPDTRLDQAASGIAGHSVNVWCEDTWSAWIHTGDYYNEDWSFLNGFTFSVGNTIYVSPRQCETLHALLNFGPAVGNYYAASAILTLAHEARHQAGDTDEGVTDCNALPLVEPLATTFFKYPKTEVESYTARVMKTVRVKGVTRRVATTVVRTRVIPARALADLKTMAYAWHKAKPAAYQGSC